MSSVVYYKFKSQKDPSRVTFDGTGISVFDLKREILIANKLQAQAETFDLKVINSDSKEEYTDDTEVIPRSTSVIARRLPASKPGNRDSAAKYVSGNMSVSGPKGGGGGGGRRHDVSNISSSSPAPSGGGPQGGKGSEEDMINAMFQTQGEQWKQIQEHMASANPVYYSSSSKNSYAHVPDHPPPPGYTCYRCGQKGHWIQACPTNNDPNWENKRVKRTTGIPRSMLKTVAKPADDQSGTYLIDANGEYVVQVADENSWKTFQERAKQQKEQKSEKPLNPDLECPLSHKLFVKPVKTPCCKTTYSEDAIQEALLESDFVCPNCKTEEVLLDQLKPDEEMEARVKQYKESLESKDSTRESLEPEMHLETRKRRSYEDDVVVGSDSNKKLKSGDGTSPSGSKSPPERKKNDGSMVATTEGTPDPTAMPVFPGMPGVPMPGIPFMMPPFMMPPYMMGMAPIAMQNQKGGESVSSLQSPSDSKS